MGRKKDVSLLDIYPKYSAPDKGGDKGTAHSYIEIYDEHLDPRKSLLEIGIWQGHSLAMFEEYFEGNVLGIDIDLSRKQFGENAKRCNATNKNDLAKILNSERFDYIIDDGSHILKDQLDSLRLLWDYLNKDGIYFIEDIVNIEAANKLCEEAKKLSSKWKLYDLRENKNRSDDILLVIWKVE